MEVPEIQAIDYYQAWSMWWSGQKLDEEFAMWGMPFLWWARGGKFLQFAGGLVVVLDLIGPERFQQAATKFNDASRSISAYFMQAPNPGDVYHHSILWVMRTGTLFSVVVLPFFAHMLPWYILVPQIILWTLASLLYLSSPTLRIAAALVKAGKHSNAAKWISFLLVIAGFHFDMLGS